jgi:hypothetical protein
MSGFTIDFAEVEIPCPRCQFANSIWLRQARLRDVVICRGCKSNIQLDDHMNEVRIGERATRQAMNDLARSLGSMKLTIML